ncbi:hypothetical protein BDB00DRAFT_879746 [Zychaea mexicana]|uniref:uncharacterized protein n=1 Tax=Zychaea mexicana TaxID=64656 RepID=UPI0022FEA35C|nr:uncharacterized protein BDB00DRAFT_879746 [Zychaea mexicana]KAI9474332.1 hypothetical protein BDB00DRAFT_879746 [Zychaea mexicana]
MATTKQNESSGQLFNRINEVLSPFLRNEQCFNFCHYLFQRFQRKQQIAILLPKHNRKTHDESKTANAESNLEKEEKRRKKEEKRKREEQKKEEKRKREEEKEEKRKREEEKKEERRKREEEKRKKKQSQLRLTSLFTKAPEEKLTCAGQSDSNQITETRNIFPPFYFKDNVVMDQWTTTNKDRNMELDHHLKTLTTDNYRFCEVSNDLRSQYLQALKQSKPELTQRRVSMKFSQFTEDVRPAYYGTWTKSSKKINGRAPLAQDDQLVVYDHDNVADPEDAGWLVPEGYLSEGEGVESDDERTSQVRPAMRPIRKRTAIRPVVVGPVFDDGDLGENDPLKRYATRMLFDFPKDKPYDPFYVEADDAANTKYTSSTADDFSKKSIASTAQHENQSIKHRRNAKTDFRGQVKLDRLLHDMSKRQIEMQIENLAVKENGELRRNLPGMSKILSATYS